MGPDPIVAGRGDRRRGAAAGGWAADQVGQAGYVRRDEAALQRRSSASVGPKGRKFPRLGGVTAEGSADQVFNRRHRVISAPIAKARAVITGLASLNFGANKGKNAQKTHRKIDSERCFAMIIQGDSAFLSPNSSLVLKQRCGSICAITSVHFANRRRPARAQEGAMTTDKFRIFIAQGGQVAALDQLTTAAETFEAASDHLASLGGAGYLIISPPGGPAPYVTGRLDAIDATLGRVTIVPDQVTHRRRSPVDDLITRVVMQRRLDARQAGPTAPPAARPNHRLDDRG